MFVLTMVIKSANLKFKKYPRHGGMYIVLEGKDRGMMKPGKY